MARVEIECNDQPTTIDSIWGGTDAYIADKSKNIANDDKALHKISNGVSWVCATCTYMHTGISKQLFLSCELCDAPSHQECTVPSKPPRLVSLVQHTPTSSIVVSASHKSPFAQPIFKPPSTQLEDRPCSSAWGSLRAPSDKDVRGPRKRRKALEPPPRILDFIVVLDFEWTADDKRKMEPIAEITQFPSVAMKLVDRKGGSPPRVLEQSPSPSFVNPSSIELPIDLTTKLTSHDSGAVLHDAYAVSVFDSFIRPTLNPTLTAFSIDLTAITQAQVDVAPPIDKALKLYNQWLASLNLIDEDGKRRGNWCFATWGDVDIMSTLRLELKYKSIELPSCFDRWINLKDDSIYKRHYGREPQGGLRACVESVGAVWEGRAHNGLVDSINTAKIVRDMARNAFVLHGQREDWIGMAYLSGKNTKRNADDTRIVIVLGPFVQWCQ